MKKYLYFSAPWCGPCKTLGPTMEKVSDVVAVRKINVDEESDLAIEYNVRNVPTVVLLDDEKEVKRFVGAKPLDVYLDEVK